MAAHSAIATTEEDIPVNFQPKTGRGNPGFFDSLEVSVVSGPGTFTKVDDYNVLLHTSNVADGFDTQYLIRPDVKPGPEQVFLEDEVITLTTIPAPATTSGISVGTPVPKAP